MTLNLQFNVKLKRPIQCIHVVLDGGRFNFCHQMLSQKIYMKDANEYNMILKFSVANVDKTTTDHSCKNKIRFSFRVKRKSTLGGK